MIRSFDQQEEIRSRVCKGGQVAILQRIEVLTLLDRVLSWPCTILESGIIWRQCLSYFLSLLECTKGLRQLSEYLERSSR